MPVSAAEIVEYLSGGSGNADPNASLGGARSSTAVTDNTTHNVWDVVGSAESTPGDTEYRCIYVRNEDPSITLQSARVWIQTQTPSSDTSIEIGLGTSAINGTEQTIANENTAPSGVTFSTAAGSGNALSIGNIPGTQHKAIWIKRIVGATAAAANDDSYVLGYDGDTAA